MKTLLLAILAALAVCVLASAGAADRLYSWTDEKGTTHFTREPPPTGSSLQDIIDYGHRSAAGPNPERRPTDRRFPGDNPRIDRPDETNVVTGAESQPTPEGPAPVSPAGPNSCYIRAPGTQVYVRVWVPDVYGDRGQEVWSGSIPPHSPTKHTPRAFQASPSDGCSITWLISSTPLCHLMCCQAWF